LIPIVSSPVSATHSSIASGMPTGLVPAFSSDLKNTEESSIAGPPGGTFDFVGKMPPSASFTAVYGQSPLDEGSSTEALAFVASKVSSHASARSPEDPDASEEDASVTVAVPRATAASDGPEARRRCETLRALRAGTETPARRCAPKTTRRAGAACAALDANVALDADAMARG
jgi:hypothetical protein